MKKSVIKGVEIIVGMGDKFEMENQYEIFNPQTVCAYIRPADGGNHPALLVH